MVRVPTMPRRKAGRRGGATAEGEASGARSVAVCRLMRRASLVAGQRPSHLPKRMTEIRYPDSEI
jgi:hypothetical protein